MAETIFDLVVIGGGPGGYVAAIRASQLGLKAAVIERENMGGICLNWGCIPTKALLRSAEVKHLAENAADFGLEISGITFDIKKVVERSRSVASRLSAGVSHLMKKNGITVISATASLGPVVENPGGDNARTITLDNGEAITGRSIILATGTSGHARLPPGCRPVFPIS